jgi:hypothetical protein
VTGTQRSRRFPCTASGMSTTTSGDVRDVRGVAERAPRTAEIKEWRASVFRLVDRPDAAAWIFRAHEPDGAGLCTVCASPSDTRNLPWPCPTHAMAENALILRAQQDRGSRGDHRPLR